MKIYVFVLLLFSFSFALNIKSNFPLPKNNIKQFYSEVKSKNLLIKALKSTNSFEKISISGQTLYLKRKYIIKSIKIVGNNSFWNRELLSISGIFENQYISVEDIKKAIFKLRQFYLNNGFLNAFIKIKAKFDSNGYVKLFIFINEGEKKYIRKVKIISDVKLSENQRKTYLKKLGLEDKPLNFLTLEKSFRKLINFLQKQGYYDAYVFLHSIYETEKNKVVAILNIINGIKYNTVFIGNYSVDKKQLEKFNPFYENGVNFYSIEKFANKIKNFYRSIGFLDADTDFLFEEDLKRKVATVKIFIYEGKPYKVNQVKIVSDKKLPQNLVNYLNSLKGKIFNKLQIEKKLYNLMRSYIKDGYINTYFVLNVKKQKNHIVNLRIKIYKGRKYIISKVEFKGYRFKDVFDTPILYDPKVIIKKKLDYEKYLKNLGYFDSKVNFKVQTKRKKEIVEVIVTYETFLGKRYKNSVPFIYGTFHLKPKVISWIIEKEKGFDKDEYDNELNTLYSSYIFKFLNPKLIKDKENKRVIKALTFLENKRGNLQGSIAYNSVERLKGSIGLYLRNLFDFGLEFNSYIEISQINTNYRVSVGSRLLPKKIQTFIGGYSSYQFHRYYDLLTQGFDLNVSRNANKWVVQRLKLDFSNNKVKPDNIFYKKYSFTLSILDDHRNDKLYPTNGYYLRANTGYVFGDVNYSFIDISLRKYFRIPFTSKVVFSQRSLLGVKFKALNKLPVSERYFIGGLFTIRGFAYEELPNSKLGGNSFFILNNEIKFPLFNRFNLYGFSFLDLGNVYQNRKSLKKFYLRKTAGLGLMVPTPAGAFMFGISTILDKKDYEDKYRFEFSISAVF